MSFLRTLKKLLLGETWVLPAGLAVVVASTVLVVRPALESAWRHAGGFVLLAGVAAVLVLSAYRSAGSGPRTPRPSAAPPSRPPRVAPPESRRAG